MSSDIHLDSMWRDRQAFPNPCSYTVTAEQIGTWIDSFREVRAIPQNPNQQPQNFVTTVKPVAIKLPYPRIDLFAARQIVVSSIAGGDTLTSTAHGLAANDIVMTSSPGFLTKSGIGRNTEYHVVAPVTANTFRIALTSGGAAIATLVNGTGLFMSLSVITVALYAATIANFEAAKLLLLQPDIFLDFHCKTWNDDRFIKTIGGRLPDAKFVLARDRVDLDDNLTPMWIHYRWHNEQVMRLKLKDVMVVRFMLRDSTTIPFFNESDLSVPTNPLKQSLITFACTPYVKSASFVNHNTDVKTL